MKVCTRVTANIPTSSRTHATSRLTHKWRREKPNAPQTPTCCCCCCCCVTGLGNQACKRTAASSILLGQHALIGEDLMCALAGISTPARDYAEERRLVCLCFQIGRRLISLAPYRTGTLYFNCT